MKKKILIANRSEIACRIAQAVAEQGMIPVGLQVPEDEQARHLSFMKQLIKVPSYLDGPAIVQGALKAQVHAVHPGYGFLSENATFAQEVLDHGLIWIGPNPKTIEVCGDKIFSKKLAASLGIPTLPWMQVCLDNNQDFGALVQEVQTIGFPLFVKASNTGGGKGLRIAEKPEFLKDALISARQEAQFQFGKGSFFCERLLKNARHIEIQVIGDGKGKGIHCFERDCSLQRRHQKIWEEAPCIGVAPSTLQELYQCALKLVEATHYRGVGTLEFLVEGNQFYFIEMNTRLQVEHGVSEEVSGIDLVHAQLDCALHLSTLPPQPEYLKLHSIEVRLYAEDPYQNYLPQPGKLTKVRWPLGAGIRVESGVEQGQSIGVGFDALLGKIIVKASSRPLALEKLRWALQDTALLGIAHNQSFLMHLLSTPEVISGNFTTSFLDQTDWGPDFPLKKLTETSGWQEGLKREKLIMNQKSPWYLP